MRIVNRPLAFVVAVALLVGGVLTVVEVIGYAITSKHVLINWTTWQQWAERTQWNRAVVKTWSIILIAVGLLLLILELKRPKVTRLTLNTEHAATDAAISRKGLADTLRSAATDVDGVGEASVSVTRTKATVTATGAAHDASGADSLTEPLTQAVQSRLDGLNLAKPPRLRVTTQSSGRS
jgi:Family of unknown function (DUF6286)